MNKSQKNLIAVLVSVIIAVLLVYYLSKSLNLNEIKATLANARYIFVLPSVLMGALAIIFRGLRWRIMLEPMGYQPKIINTIAATAIRYFANIIIPRSGEVFRCSSLYYSDKVPINKSFGTVITERIIDLLCFLVLFLITALLNVNLFTTFLNEKIALMQSGEKDWTVPIVVIGGFVLVSLLLFFTQTYWKQSKIYKKVSDLFHGFGEGLLSIRKLKNRNLFILYTLIIWALYFYMTYVVVFALKEASDMGQAQGLFLLFAGAIGMIIPASGGIGSYHAAMGVAFAMLGYTEELGNSFALLVHTPHTLLALGLGFISIIIIYYSYKKNQ